MTIQPTFLLIADIAGYTRFMKLHTFSLVHAQDIVARLLEAVIDATHGQMKLAKLEGDAAFFYFSFPAGAEPTLEFVAEQAAAIYRAFHARAADLKANTLCPCDGCQQAGLLKIKLVGHLGEAAVQKVKHLTELAGVDVILVHRLLKNNVPVPEYLLMTLPVWERIEGPVHDRAAATAVELEEFGRTQAFFFDLERYAGEVPPASRLSFLARLGRHLKLTARSVPYLVGARRACAGFRNVDTAPAPGTV